jgi:hypothetical protein
MCGFTPAIPGACAVSPGGVMAVLVAGRFLLGAGEARVADAAG